MCMFECLKIPHKMLLLLPASSRICFVSVPDPCQPDTERAPKNTTYVY
jgi:hypothetical protein